MIDLNPTYEVVRSMRINKDGLVKVISSISTEKPLKFSSYTMLLDWKKLFLDIYTMKYRFTDSANDYFWTYVNLLFQEEEEKNQWKNIYQRRNEEPFITEVVNTYKKLYKSVSTIRKFDKFCVVSEDNGKFVKFKKNGITELVNSKDDINPISLIHADYFCKLNNGYITKEY